MFRVVVLSAWLAYVASILWKMKTDDAFFGAYYERSRQNWFWRKVLGENPAPEVLRTYAVRLGAATWLLVLIAVVVSVMAD